MKFAFHSAIVLWTLLVYTYNKKKRNGCFVFYLWLYNLNNVPRYRIFWFIYNNNCIQAFDWSALITYLGQHSYTNSCTQSEKHHGGIQIASLKQIQLCKQFQVMTNNMIIIGNVHRGSHLFSLVILGINELTPNEITIFSPAIVREV